MNDVDLATQKPGSAHSAPADTAAAQQQVWRINRALAMVNACTEIIMRGQDEAQMLHDVCRLVVEHGGYLMAWVCLADPNAVNGVQPVAQFGNMADCPGPAGATCVHTESGRRISGDAIRTGSFRVEPDCLATPTTRPWRARAAERGMQPRIALPLMDGATALGAFTICALDPHAFDAEAVSLLERLSLNLAYGIQRLREQQRHRAIEQELRDSEQRFRALVEHAPDAIIVFDADRECMVDANAGAEQLFQCSREQLLQHGPRDFCPPDQPDTILVEYDFSVHLARTLAGQQQVFERLVRGARGRETLCEVRLVRLPAEGRKLVRGSLTDITARKRQQQELRHSLEANAVLKTSTGHLQSILDNLFAYVVLLDPDGVIQEINQAPLERAKFRREEAVGRRFCDLPCWSYDDAVRSRMEEAVSAARRGQILRYDTVLDMAGERIPVDFQIAPVRNANGEIEALLATAVDMTERHKADEALRESESKFRILFESADDCLLLVSMDGRILDINRNGAKRLGYTKEEMVGRGIAEFDPPEFAARVRQRMEQIKRDKQAVFESAHVRKDGSRMPVEVNSILIEQDGSTIAFSVIRDITARKLAELAITDAMQQLRNKEMAKTRFLAAAGHDLRQPLMAASLYIDTLKRTRLAPAQQEIVDRLGHAMGTFRALLDALLNISKFDAGAVRPEWTSISVPELLIWLEDNFAPMARNKGIDCRLFFPMKEQLIVRSDAGLLKSVLMNLTSNAIKFTSHGAILLSARRRGNEVLFQVWDTGIGIGEEHVSHIFDEFYQVNNTQRDRTIGLGLGLAIAARAIALLGGRIECRSQPGRGSVFSFRLPLATTPDRATPLQEPAIRQESAAGKRFVVVEDDALVAQALSKALSMVGGEVRCFQDAEGALLHGDTAHADYYIVDYTLGGTLTGVQFLNCLRRQLDRPVLAVLVTGDTSPDFVRSMAECHWPVLHKPVNLSDVLTSLSALEAGAGGTGGAPF